MGRRDGVSVSAVPWEFEPRSLTYGNCCSHGAPRALEGATQLKRSSTLAGWGFVEIHCWADFHQLLWQVTPA